MAITNYIPSGGGFDYQIVEYSKTATVSANTHYQFLTENEIKAKAPNGYAFLGWLTFTGGAARFVPSVMTESQFFIYVIGTGGTANLRAKALYVKEK